MMAMLCGPKMSPGYPRVLPGLFWDYPRVIPRLSPGYPRVIPGLSMSYPRVIPGLSRRHPRFAWESKTDRGYPEYPRDKRV